MLFFFFKKKQSSAVLVEMWSKLLLSKHKIDLSALKPEQRDRALMRLNASADKCKTALSGLPETDIVCDSVVPDLDLRVKVSRAEMEVSFFLCLCHAS